MIPKPKVDLTTITPGDRVIFRLTASDQITEGRVLGHEKHYILVKSGGTTFGVCDTEILSVLRYEIARKVFELQKI